MFRLKAAQTFMVLLWTLPLWGQVKRPSLEKKFFDVKILTQEAILVHSSSSEPRIFGESVPLWNRFNDTWNILDGKESSKLLRHSFKPANRKFDQLIVVSATTPDNYYHWLFDVLPALEKISKSQQYHNGIPIAVGGSQLSFQTESLLRIGILPSRLIWIGKDDILYAQEVFQANLTHKAGHPHTPTYSWVKNLFLGRSTMLPWRKIYISRAKDLERQVRNEKNLVDKLLMMGFEIHNLSKLSLRKKAQLFSEAKVIVSPHGAGLSNIVFSSAQTKIVEFFPENFINYCYQRMAKDLAFNYSSLVFPSSELSETEKANFVIDVKIDELLEYLKN